MTEPKQCRACGSWFRTECPNGPHDWIDRYDFPEGAYPAPKSIPDSHIDGGGDDGDSDIGDVEKRPTYHTRHGRTFREARHRALHNHEWRCVECGMSDATHQERYDLWPPTGGLHVHHKIPVERFDDPEHAHIPINLEPLCDACHKEKTRSE